MRGSTTGISLVRAVLRQGCSAAILLAALALGACATMPEEEPTTSADATRAEALYRSGDMDQAAAAFHALAESSGGDTAAHYRLRAAEALREAGDLDGAARELGDLKRRRLHGADQMRLDLLDAEIALKHGDAAQARALLTMQIADLPPHLRARALELRARAEVAAGDRYTGARTRALLDRYLEGADRDQNRKEIIETLAALEVDDLRAQRLLDPWTQRIMRARTKAKASRHRSTSRCCCR